MPEAENAILEADQTDANPAPKRKFAKQLSEAPVKEPIVTCRVTSRGADKISTGVHLDVLGDEKYAAGEEYKTELSNALMMRDGDLAYWLKHQDYRDYVDIIDANIERTDFRSMVGVRQRG